MIPGGAEHEATALEPLVIVDVSLRLGGVAGSLAAEAPEPEPGA